MIIVSAKDDEISLIRGLNKGADDYISKPFSLYELSARVKRNIRRYTVFAEECGDFTIDETKMKAYYKELLIPLTLKEYELLRTFLSSPYKMLSRDELFNEVWGYDYAGESRTLDMHVASLREKLKKMGANDHIETVRGVGYRFTP